MSFLSRVKKIIQSNIESGTDNIDITDYNIDDDTKNADYKNTNENDNTNSVEPDIEYYAILEVEYGADFEEIKKSYRRLLKKYHPDRFHNQPEKFKTAEQLIQKLNEAYSYFENKNK